MKKRMILFTCIFTMLASSLAVLAQDQVKQRENAETRARMATELRAKIHGQAERNMMVREDNTFTFIAAEGGFGGSVVKGAPYSAEAVSENIQVLQDGNRIARKNTSAIYRDSEGRTRHEQTLRTIGPYASAGDPPKTFMIFDPVASVHYSLDPDSKVARKMELPRFEKVGAGAGDTVVFTANASEERVRRVGPPPVVGVAGVPVDKQIALAHVEAQGGRVEVRSTIPDNVKKESLGKQVIEGVEAEGTRTTYTIPAGEIGNELPINIVTESWYSPELQVTVMRKHTDPRQGEMTYRLTNIRRTEPDRSLFEVPSDYTVKESMPSKVRLDLERELVREKMKKNNDQ
jgi:hypothetical protein